VKRLACRLLLIGLSVSVLSAAVFATVGQLKLTLVKLPNPLELVVIRIDSQGWIFQSWPTRQTEASFTTHTYNGTNDRNWCDSMSDLSPTWITPGIVYAHWQAAASKYQLIGIGHKTILFALGMATVAMTLWYRRRWPSGKDSE